MPFNKWLLINDIWNSNVTMHDVHTRKNILSSCSVHFNKVSKSSHGFNKILLRYRVNNPKVNRVVAIKSFGIRDVNTTINHLVEYLGCFLHTGTISENWGEVRPQVQSTWKCLRSLRNGFEFCIFVRLSYAWSFRNIFHTKNIFEQARSFSFHSQ